MIKTDYKFWYIKRNDNGFITECAIRFYEGDYQDKTVYDGVTRQHVVKNKYVRSKRLETFNELKHLAKNVKGVPTIKGISENNGNTAVLYHPEDFGEIKTDDELRSFLDKEIAKDKKRSPIQEQQVK